jgi:C-terminal processing protease CtpA/Prc
MLRRGCFFLLALVALAFTAELEAADRNAATPLSPEKPGEGSAPLPAKSWADVRKETLRLVWSVVNESYFDATFGGVDWRAVGERANAQLPAIENNEQLQRLLQTMLAELGRSHFSILPREAAVFQPGERGRIGTTGAEVAWVDDHVLVSRVQPGSAADRAGLKVGMRLERVGDYSLSEIAAALRRANVPAAQMSRHLTALAMGHLSAAVGRAIRLEVQERRRIST